MIWGFSETPIWYFENGLHFRFEISKAQTEEYQIEKAMEPSVFFSESSLSCLVFFVDLGAGYCGMVG